MKMSNAINFKATKVFNDIWSAIKTQKSCRDIVETDWIKWLSDPMGRKSQLEKKEITIVEFDKRIKEESLLKYFIRNKTHHTWTFIHNKSFIRFTGLDDENDAMGMTQDICWINEPYVFSHDVYLQLAQRTSKYILFDWNPKQNHWIDIERQKDNTITLKSTLLDNPFCPEESRKQILSYQPVNYCDVVLNGLIDEKEIITYDFDKNTLNFTTKQINEAKRCIYNQKVGSAREYNWQVYGLGEKAEKPNRIFKFKEISDIEYQNIDLPVFYGCDWGKVDPWGIVEAKYKDGDLYLHEKNYLSENQWREKINASERNIINAYDNDDEVQNEGIVTWIFEKLNIPMDRPVICDNNRPVKIALLRRKGYEIHLAQKPKGSILDGIDLIENLNVYYTKSSTYLAYEQENYSRKTDKFGTILEEPEDKDNHLMDCIRYIVTHLQSEGILIKV
jgi:PBSX family phage terminase large subunit